jgi:hypothetical protein
MPVKTRLAIRLLFRALDAACLVAHRPRKLCTNDERNIAGYLHRLRRILLYQSMGCVRPLGKSHEQRDRTGYYERDEYDYEYVEWDTTRWGTRRDITI